MKHLKAFEAKRLPKNNQVICEDDLGEISALFQEVADKWVLTNGSPYPKWASKEHFYSGSHSNYYFFKYKKGTKKSDKIELVAIIDLDYDNNDIEHQVANDIKGFVDRVKGIGYTCVVDGDYYRCGSDSNTYPYSKFYKIVIY